MDTIVPRVRCTFNSQDTLMSGVCAQRHSCARTHNLSRLAQQFCPHSRQSRLENSMWNITNFAYFGCWTHFLRPLLSILKAISRLTLYCLWSFRLFLQNLSGFVHGLNFRVDRRISFFKLSCRQINFLFLKLSCFCSQEHSICVTWFTVELAVVVLSLQIDRSRILFFILSRRVFFL